MLKQSEIKQKLTGYFEQQPDVEMAFGFGSRFNNQATMESDYDIAVYFKPKSGSIEYEDKVDYPDENKIWQDIERITQTKTDLVVLNRAPAMIAFSALKDGQPLLIRHQGLYLGFYLLISQLAEDFRMFLQDYWKIKQRSMSLNPVDAARLIKIIDFFESEFREFSQFKPITYKDYMNNPAQRRNLERWIENIINASIDIAKILLASERKPMPSTYRETLENLTLLNGFEKETAVQLSTNARLRNVLAHEYLDIRFDQIRKFLDESWSSYQRLLDFVKAILNK